MVNQIEQFFNKSYLDRCQVYTPDNIVKWAWDKIHEIQRKPFGRVLDLGCGDGRFSLHGKYKSYYGIEIDSKHPVCEKLPSSVVIENKCGLLNSFNDYDLAIGNPPYVRHHDMDSEWQELILAELFEQTGYRIDMRANAYMSFMLKSLISTKNDGLVALIVPVEWTSRPSAMWLREYIKSEKWSIDIYKFPDNVFSGVLTTATLTIINKNDKSSEWRYFELDNDFRSHQKANVTGTGYSVLKYTGRNDDLYAHRGLSPGTQKVFCLTEGQRLHNRLKKGIDVIPCITTLKHMPSNIKVLTENAFKKYYVDSGERCWLIRSDKGTISGRLRSYISNVDELSRNTSTCNERPIWYKYDISRAPEILLSSGFIKFGPKLYENKIKAIPLGSVAGVHIRCAVHSRPLANWLRKYNFESRIVNYSGKLKKIAINQLNTVLINYLRKVV